jgi:predicted ATP-binding protein involved in virulence
MIWNEAELGKRHEVLVEQLTLLVANSDLQDSQRELAGAWRARLEAGRKRFEASLSVAFVAQVGQGKSTLIAEATGLRLDVAGDPKQWSVLPVGDGLTTLGETQLHFETRTDIAVEVDPIPREQLALELTLFAEDEWKKEHEKGSSKPRSEAGEELHRLLRNWLAPGAKNPRDEVVALARASATTEALVDEMRKHLDLDARVQPWSRTFSHNSEGLASLKATLRAIMQGKLLGAPAPSIIHIRLPKGPLGQLTTLVDTRGVDPKGAELSIEGRADLRRRLDDPDTLFVVCTEFETGLGVVAHKLLEALHGRSIGVRNRARTWRLVIVDKRTPIDDDEVEERHFDGEERRQVCLDKLREAGIPEPEGAVQVIDARTDGESLRAMIFGLVTEERARRLQLWREVYDEARAAVEHLAEFEFAAQARELDLRLWWIWDAAVAAEDDGSIGGLGGSALAIRSADLDHWSHLYAASRRRGRYSKFDLAVLGANRATGVQNRGAFAGLEAIEDYVERTRESREPRLANHLELRLELVRSAVHDYVLELARLWEKALIERFESAETNELWMRSQARWGEGSGYVHDVARYVADEARRLEVMLHPAQLPRPVEERLPRRPALLSITKVSIRNFRGVEAGDIQIGPQTTVLIGDNGVGKTAWLEATAKAVGVLLPGMGADVAPALRRNDIRQVTVDEGGDVPGMHFQLPMELTVSATLQGRALEWGRAIDDPPLNDELNEREVDGEEALRLKAREIAEDIGKEVRSQGERQLPVLAYYGTQRLWPPDLVPEDRREVGSRLDGYRNCLQAASTHAHMLEWMRKFTMVELQRNQPVTQLRAIERAVVACVPEAASFGYALDIEDLVLVTEAGERRPFRLLSDGYRNIVAMVADIAWRASRLNPQLGADASTRVEGVVLIDEIDLHLHPKWQREVLGDLRRTFPRLQFVVTTHSPFIIQSLDERDQLVNLDPDAPEALYRDRSPEDITEDIMGVELPQRSARRQREAEVAAAYYDLLERVPEADPELLARLEAELDELTAPYDDNQAFVVFLQRQRDVARSKRS